MKISIAITLIHSKVAWYWYFFIYIHTIAILILKCIFTKILEKKKQKGKMRTNGFHSISIHSLNKILSVKLSSSLFLIRNYIWNYSLAWKRKIPRGLIPNKIFVIPILNAFLSINFYTSNLLLFTYKFLLSSTSMLLFAL